MTTKIGIISGFLGSGKTTAIIEIGKMLDYEHELKSAILMNDIGQVNVDDAFIEGMGMQAAQITGKCICCTLGTSFQDTIKVLQETFQPDVILIEPTGIAIPERVRDRFHEGLFGDGFEVAPLIVLVDGYRFLDFVDTIDELIERQTQGVEIIAINKMDLVDNKEKLEKIKESVRKINPEACIMEMSAKNREGIDKLVDIIIGNGTDKNA